MRRHSVRLVTAAAVLSVLAACGSDGSADVTASAAAEEPTAAPVAVEPEPTVEPTAVPAATVAPTAEPADEPVEQEPAAPLEGDGLFPTVVSAQARLSEGDTWRFDVTLSSEYDSPARYADAWRVLDADDNELGIRVLGHDHANEQPFTRSHSVDVPGDLTTVFIEGRDQLNGWSGERYELGLNRS